MYYQLLTLLYPVDSVCSSLVEDSSWVVWLDLLFRSGAAEIIPSIVMLFACIIDFNICQFDDLRI